MDLESMKELLNEETWQQYSRRLKDKEKVEVLHRLFDHIVATLRARIDDVKVEDDKAISFYSKDKEFLTINITRKDLRIYIHPKAQAFFDMEAKFKVERFRFWDGSYHKSSGKYRAMSFWISKTKFIPGAKEILKYIPETLNDANG